jgi:ATP-dependent Clp protease ATP-binding subunit ClpA
VCGDPALERRFQKIAVRELTAEETLEILRARKERLERHHNVVITEEALRASLELTDKHVTDRMRPDRAIDVLDEACAHTHAVARYSPEAERLVVERRAMMRGQPMPERERASANASANAANEEDVEDPLGRMARDGFAALERFGAELEAMFAGAPETAGAGSPRATSTSSAEVSSAPRPMSPAGRRLAELDAELDRRLVEEGIVVRGHDVARVVGVATGRRVMWAE